MLLPGPTRGLHGDGKCCRDAEPGVRMHEAPQIRVHDRNVISEEAAQADTALCPMYNATSAHIQSVVCWQS